MKRTKRLIAWLAAVSTLGTGMLVVPTAATAVTEAPAAATASTESPIADFDFNAAPDNGVFANGDAKATVNGTANLVAGADGQGTAAQLGSGFWMNVTKTDGSPLLAGLDDATISYDSLSNNATSAGWTVYAAPNANAVNGSAPTYLGVMDQTSKLRVERYANGRDDNNTIISTATRTAWKHVDLVISNKVATLYVDKKFVTSSLDGKTLAQMLSGSGGVLQIGKANWGGGEYFNGILDNLRIYGSALSSTQLGVAQPTAVTIGGDGVADGKLSVKEGSAATLSATVAPSGADPGMTWSSNNPAVATVSTAGAVTALKAGTATITAASAADPSVKGSLEVTVTSVKPDEQYGYVMVHFIEDNQGYAEKIYLDISRGDDPTHWDTLNGGEPILASNESTTGVRDPFIAYNPESQTYYILATDLRVFGGDNAGWTKWTENYSTKLHVWESKDLVHFNDMTELDTAVDPTTGQHATTITDTVTGNDIQDIGMAWAPEATWVSDFNDLNDDGKDNGTAAGGAFVMYWSVNATVDGVSGKHVVWASTKDFTNNTFKFGGVFVPCGIGPHGNGNTIDTTMLQNLVKGADGTEHLRSYRMTGTTNIIMEYTDRADWWKAPANATEPSQGWVYKTEKVGRVFGSNQEGANGFKVNGENKWILFVDNFGSVNAGARYGYNPLVTTDLDAEGDPWKALDTTNFSLTDNTKHGGVVSITKAQYDAIRAADAKSSDNKDLTTEAVSVEKNASSATLKAAMPKTQKVTLANSQGTAERDVQWDLSDVDTSTAGTYTVTGTVDTIGANLNHWTWKNAAGEVNTDTDGLINTGANANNSWKQSGGFDATAADRPLYSSTAITVQAKVTVAEPTDPDLLADFTFESGGSSFDGGNAVGQTQGAATLADGNDGKAAKLSSNFWLNVTAKDGSPLLAGLDDVTISYDSKPDAASNTGWTVFAAANQSTQLYGQEHYLGVLDKTSGVTLERYSNSGSRDATGNIVYANANNGWKHVDIVVSGAVAKLYVDQKLVAINTNGKTLSAIVTGTGGVLQIGKANWGLGEYYSGLLDNLKIYGKALNDEELGVESAKSDPAAALAIPAEITGDLPSSVLGKTIAWKAEGDGSANVKADGTVTRPAAGQAAVSVKLTATIQGVATPVVAQARILNDGGDIASYVKTVDRSNSSGEQYDPLAYNDDRRADSLFVSAKAAGQTSWENLNRSQSILYVKWDGTQSANPNAQMGSPSFYRTAGGKLGVVSSQNNATSSIYLWDSPDGVTFTNQRTLSIGGGSIVSNPRIVYDASSTQYKVFWTDVLSGEGRVATLTDLTASAQVGEPTQADPADMGVSGQGLPAWAAQSQASSFALSSDEYEAVYKYYVDLRNTGVQALANVDVDNGSALNIADLPKQATMEYNDGSTKSLNVQWDEQTLKTIDTAKAGTYAVTGTVQQDPQDMVNDARADPHIFYNEDDGYYYLTGSTYEVPSTGPATQSTSYRSIGLKRAKTIAELKDAEESIIIKPENGTPGHMDQYPNSFYGWSAFIWAQEFHKINGRWYIVAGFHKGDSTAAGGWCNNTILIPYTGDEQSIKDGGMLKPENWGEPSILQGAAFDVTYYERQENGVTQGYWLQPSGAKLYVAKATMGDKNTIPLPAGDFKQVYGLSQPWEYGKQAPTPGDDAEGSDQGIVEAPYMVEYGDYVYITYSGGTVDKYYDMGMLRAKKNADLQDAASWTQVSFPVLSTNDTYTGKYGTDPASGTGIAGPGHNSFVVDESGNLALAFHARAYPEQHTGSAAGGLFDPDRNTWLKSVNVRANGMLDLSLDQDQEVAPENRTVTISIVVGAAPTIPVESVQITAKGAADGKLTLDKGDIIPLNATVSPANASDQSVSWKSSDTSLATVGDDGVLKALKAGTVTITATAGGATGTLSVTIKDSGTPDEPNTPDKPTDPGQTGGNASSAGKGGSATHGVSGLANTGATAGAVLAAVMLLMVAGASLLGLRRSGGH